MIYTIASPSGHFTLTVPDGGIGPDGRSISAEKAADLILTRGFVRRDLNAARDDERLPGPGLRLKYSGVL